MSNTDKSYSLLKRMEIPFSEYVEIAKKRRPTAYVKGKCRVPKKYLTDEYGWNKKGLLCNLATGEVLIKNTLTVGTPRYKKVNGQDIYNGNVSRQARATLVKCLHQTFAKYLRDFEPLQDIESYPLGIHITFYVQDRGKHNIDNDNKWIWEKIIQDTLTEEGIIPDDNPYVINENLKRTILVSSDTDERLAIEIYGYTTT